MSALYSRGVRAMSPHRKTLLAGLPCRDAPPQTASELCNSADTRCAASAFLSTSRCCQTQGPQTTYAQTSTLRKDAQEHGAGRGRGMQHPQSVGKVLQQVHMSSWARGSLSSIFNGMGAFASLPNRLVDEMGKMIGRSSKKVDAVKVVKDSPAIKTLLPVAEEAKTSEQVSKPVSIFQKSETVEYEREQHTFEKAMMDTQESISSFYRGYSSPNIVPKPTLPGPKPASPLPASPQPACAEEEVGWNVLRRFPLSFMDSGTQTQVKKKPLIRKDFVSRSAIEARTRALVGSLKAATTYSSKITRVQDLCRHLKQFPSGRHEATEFKVVPILLNMVQFEKEDLQEEAREALTLLGYSPPVKGRGVRILSLDGGGTRGLLSIQCLMKLEELTNRKVYELFDYVCGVSTGALIAAIVCLYRLPLDECQRLYLEFSRKMFNRSRVIGTGGLVWNHSFYDSDQWEQILKSEIGHKTMIEFARDPDVPKMSAISTLMNMPRLKNFVFRNYNLPPSTYSAYPGSCVHQLWEVIRASSAAPGYYEDFPLGDYVHSDGGISINNPTALAVHESRLLWPHETIQCVVSLGTGRYEPQMGLGSCSKVSLREKVNKIVDSATDTEGVHVMMSDLMPPATYFRFNPYLSDDLPLDEIRQDRLDSMRRDTTMYLRKNENKMRKAAETLRQGRLAHQHAMDWIKLKADSLL